MSTIFDALRTQIGSYLAVTDLVATRIRPIRFPSSDDIRAGAGILIDPLEEINQQDIAAIGGAELLKLRFRCVGSTLAAAYAAAQALYNNGTSPATGLNGFKGTVNGIAITAIALSRKEFDFEFFEDGGDEGYYVVDWHAEVCYSEPV